MKTILFFMSGYSWAEVRYRDAVFQCARAGLAHPVRALCAGRREPLSSAQLLGGV